MKSYLLIRLFLKYDILMIIQSFTKMRNFWSHSRIVLAPVTFDLIILAIKSVDDFNIPGMFS